MRRFGGILSSCPNGHFHHRSISLRGKTSNGVVPPFRSGCQLLETSGSISPSDLPAGGRCRSLPRRLPAHFGQPLPQLRPLTVACQWCPHLEHIHAALNELRGVVVSGVLPREAFSSAFHSTTRSGWTSAKDSPGFGFDDGTEYPHFPTRWNSRKLSGGPDTPRELDTMFPCVNDYSNRLQARREEIDIEQTIHSSLSVSN